MRGFLVVTVLLALCSISQTQVRIRTEPAAGGGGGPTLIFDSTFNCADWTQSHDAVDNGTPDCSDDPPSFGFQKWGNWYVGSFDQIFATANFSGGGGSKGFRHYISDGFDNNGGGIRIDVPTAGQTELYLTWYIRYKAGATWAGAGGNPQFIKMLYFNVGASPANAIGITSAGGFGTTQFFPVSRNVPDTGLTSWTSVFGNPSDGLFHCLQVHLKTDTNGSDGIFQMKADGTTVADVSDVNYGGASFTEAGTDNQNDPANGAEVWADYDDVSMAATDWAPCRYAVGT